MTSIHGSFFQHYIPSPLGELLAQGTQEQLISLQFVAPGDTRVQTLDANVPFFMQTLERELSQYFAGTRKEFSTPLYLPNHSFSHRVWRAVYAIPFGARTSYKAIGEKAGYPKAYQAVGTAIGKNPFLILVPCHRILNSNGEIGGFSSGIERKIWLLQHEGYTHA